MKFEKIPQMGYAQDLNVCNQGFINGNRKRVEVTVLILICFMWEESSGHCSFIMLLILL